MADRDIQQDPTFSLLESCQAGNEIEWLFFLCALNYITRKYYMVAHSILSVSVLTAIPQSFLSKTRSGSGSGRSAAAPSPPPPEWSNWW